MVDPSSFGTALWTVVIVTALIVAFGLAALADMAMRRREDRAARTAAAQRRRSSEAHAGHGGWERAVHDGNRSNGSGPTHS
ncbi:hypothetical protein [Nocardiopsis halotolerans]|uniref:hypothetical protein n=1 Tax=Nocardiopsis halotolerans TaxID=124252 RepID=UPI00034DDAB4|nr:hypothetical protein [Nocardiopsis halotolerans]